MESGVNKDSKKPVQLLGSGSILNEVRKAAKMLKDDYGVDSNVWAVTSYNELTRDGQHADRHNLLNPGAKTPAQAYVTEVFKDQAGPVIASSDYMKNLAEQIRKWVPANYRVLGCDGFGRSDSRKQLRHFFEVDANWIVVAALSSLAEEGTVKASEVTKAIKALGLDVNKPNPMTV